MDPLVQAMMQAEYGSGPYGPLTQRSESTLNERARRDLGGLPPVTILQDLVGRAQAAMGNQAGNRANSFIDALRQRDLDVMSQTGGPAIDNLGSTSTYGQPLPAFANPALK